MAFERRTQIARTLRAASDDGDAYSWSVGIAFGINDTGLCLRNDSATRTLHIDQVIVAGDTASQIWIHHADICTDGGAVVGVNLNVDSAKVADATCLSDEQDNTRGDILADFLLPASTTKVVELDRGNILGLDDCIAVDFLVAQTIGCVTFIGHFED